MPGRPTSVLALQVLVLGAVVMSSHTTVASVQLKDPAIATSFADALYEIISPGQYAIRLFNRRGWSCSHTVDKLRNESQALFPIASADDLAFFVGTTFDDKKALFVNNSMMGDSNLFGVLANTSSVSAIFLQFINASDCPGCSAQGASLGPKYPFGTGTPSEGLNPSADRMWNPTGSGVVMANYSFPIFMLPDQQSSDFAYGKAMANVYTEDSNSGTVSATWPYVAAEPHLYLGPEEMTSVDCLTMSNVREGSKYCDPLGGQSIWAAAQNNAGEPAAITRDDTVVLVAAAMDVRSLIQTQPGLGADQTVSALVATLAAANAVAGTTSCPCLPVFGFFFHVVWC